MRCQLRSPRSRAPHRSRRRRQHDEAPARSCGGDRQLNRALNTIVLTRIRTNPESRAYVDRRLAEGKTAKEIRRCLKRYIARQIFRTLNAAQAIASAA